MTLSLISLISLISRVAVVAVVLFIAAACTPEAELPDGGVAVAVGDGLRDLVGDDSTPALTALPALGPATAALDTIDADGLVRNRAELILDATATLGQVRGVLTRFSAGVVATAPGETWLLLGIPAESDLAALQITLADIAAQPGVLFAIPVAVPGINALATPTGVPAEAVHDQLRGPSVPAAWNVVQLARDRDRAVPLVVADVFASTSPQPQLPGLSFPSGIEAFTRELPVPGGFFTEEGNHGLWVAGIAAAAHDATSPTGVHPEASLMPLQAAQIGGLVLPNDVMARMGRSIPASGNFVINFSLGYNDPGFRIFTPTNRAVHAVQWRAFMEPFASRALVVASAGNDGLTPAFGARFNSFMTLAARTADLGSVVAPADGSNFATFLAQTLQRHPSVDGVVGRTLIVGGTDADGGPFDRGSAGFDVAMPAVDVIGVCLSPSNDVLCEDGVYKDQGTSGASPQVAAVAAYLWNLEPDLTVDELAAIIIDAAVEGSWVEAYAAVLALESTSHATPVRRTLLDFDDDGEVDDVDVELFEAALGEGSATTKDFSRFDLNGDGFTSDETSAPLDVALDGIITVVSDRQVFCGWTNAAAGVITDPVALTNAADACTPPTVTSFSPTRIFMNVGDTQQFTATTSPSDAELVWSTNVGTIDQQGFFTAGQNPSVGEILAVVAPNTFGVAAVSILNAGSFPSSSSFANFDGSFTDQSGVWNWTVEVSMTSSTTAELTLRRDARPEAPAFSLTAQLISAPSPSSGILTELPAGITQFDLSHLNNGTSQVTLTGSGLPDGLCTTCDPQSVFAADRWDIFLSAQ